MLDLSWTLALTTSVKPLGLRFKIRSTLSFIEGQSSQVRGHYPNNEA
jgi:hypothetical protein